MNQTLLVTELPRLAAIQADAPGFQLNLIGGMGLDYDIEVSTDLVQWMTLVTLTNSARVTWFADLDSTNYTQRFYRARQRD